MSDIPSLVDLEDHMDFGDEGRRMIREAKRVADGEIRCPPCKGEGQISYVFDGEPKFRECPDCEGGGWLTRDQQSRYYHEAGHSDADAERDAISRREQEDEDRWMEEERQAEEQVAEMEADYEEEQRARDEEEEL